MERIEKEIVSKIFMINDYTNSKSMEEQIREYIKKLKIKFPTAIVTREFFKGENILVRATEISYKKELNTKEINREDEWYIRQRGER